MNKKSIIRKLKSSFLLSVWWLFLLTFFAYGFWHIYKYGPDEIIWEGKTSNYDYDEVAIPLFFNAMDSSVSSSFE